MLYVGWKDGMGWDGMDGWMVIIMLGLLRAPSVLIIVQCTYHGRLPNKPQENICPASKSLSQGTPSVRFL